MYVLYTMYVGKVVQARELLEKALENAERSKDRPLQRHIVHILDQMNPDT